MKTDTSGEAVLQVRDLSVAYGKVVALHKANLQVGAGQIITVIGPNGASKTTLLSAIMSLLPADGEIILLGERLNSGEVESLVSKGLSLVPEKRELFASMSVEDNLLLGAFARYQKGERDYRKTMEQVFQSFPRLRERRMQLAGTLSGGERAMLVLGRALMGKPKVLMLDEPSLGLAPLIVREIFRIIADLKNMGVGILLVEQNARAALAVSDYGYVLETGNTVLEGPSHQLAGNPKVIESYLGVSRSAPS